MTSLNKYNSINTPFPQHPVSSFPVIRNYPRGKQNRYACQNNTSNQTLDTKFLRKQHCNLRYLLIKQMVVLFRVCVYLCVCVSTFALFFLLQLSYSLFQKNHTMAKKCTSRPPDIRFGQFKVCGTCDYVLQSHATNFGAGFHELHVAQRTPQPYMELSVCQDFGTLGPLASEYISWSPGIRFGCIKECNSYTTCI